MSEIIAENDPRIALGHQRMLDYWTSIGVVEDDVISFLINPMFTGAPAWPNTRQAYRIIRTAHSLILASDGLADPFVDTDMSDVSGYGMEAYLEIAGAQSWPLDQIMDSAAFQLIKMVAQNVAGHGGVDALLDKYGVLSMALPLDVELAEGWHDADGQLGVLLGVSFAGRPDRVDLPFGPCRITSVTPIRPSELAVAARSASARQALAAALAALPGSPGFDADRPALPIN